MSAIYRVSLPVEDYQEVELTGPPISVAPDRGGSDGKFDLWYEHDDGHQPRTRAIYVFGTGHPTPWSDFTRENWEFIGTVVNSFLVWHVYWGPKHGDGLYS